VTAVFRTVLFVLDNWHGKGDRFCVSSKLTLSNMDNLTERWQLTGTGDRDRSDQ
jgi:hypothetical protein